MLEEGQVLLEANGFGVGDVIGDDVLPVRIGQDARGREPEAVNHSASLSARVPAIEIAGRGAGGAPPSAAPPSKTAPP